jgi:hypothetical protein
VDYINLAGDKKGWRVLQSNEIAGSLKVGSFIDQLSDCKRFNNVCAL